MDNLLVKIKALDPELTSSSQDETLATLLEQGKMIALSDKLPYQVVVDHEEVPIREMGTIYMALHFLALQQSQGKGVTVEKASVIEVHYSDLSNLDWLNSSKWGQAYLRLYELYGAGRRHYRVIES